MSGSSSATFVSMGVLRLAEFTGVGCSCTHLEHPSLGRGTIVCTRRTAKSEGPDPAYSQEHGQASTNVQVQML